MRDESRIRMNWNEQEKKGNRLMRHVTPETGVHSTPYRAVYLDGWRSGSSHLGPSDKREKKS